MSDLLPSILILANLAIIIGGIFAARIVVKSSLAKSETEIKERIVNDLSKENKILRERVQRTENLVQTLVTMLKKIYHIEIEVDGEMIYMRSPNGTHSGRVQSGP